MVCHCGPSEKSGRELTGTNRETSCPMCSVYLTKETKSFNLRTDETPENLIDFGRNRPGIARSNKYPGNSQNVPGRLHPVCPGAKSRFTNRPACCPSGASGSEGCLRWMGSDFQIQWAAQPGNIRHNLQL